MQINYVLFHNYTAGRTPNGVRKTLSDYIFYRATHPYGVRKDPLEYIFIDPAILNNPYGMLFLTVFLCFCTPLGVHRSVEQ